MRCVVLVFGEDDTDRRSLAALIHAVNASLRRPVRDLRVVAVRKPMILSRNAARQKKVAFAEQIAAIARAETTKITKPIVVAHRDCDAVEPAHLHEAADLISDLQKVGVRTIIPATPAWEVETWWMLFPSAAAAVRGCWSSINYANAHVGLIEDSKKRLTRDLRPTSANARNRCDEYTERDGIKIAEEIRRQGLLKQPYTARSDSFEHFRNMLVTAFTDSAYH